MAAPGSDIFSTWPGVDDSYLSISGTSMATPHVAGAAAMVYGRSGKKLTGVQVKKILMDTADRLPALKGKCVSGGRLNLYKALLAVKPAGRRL